MRKDSNKDKLKKMKSSKSNDSAKKAHTPSKEEAALDDAREEVLEQELAGAEKEVENSIRKTIGLNDMYQLRRNNRLFAQVIFFLVMAVVALVAAFPLMLPLKETKHHFIVMETENGVKVADVVEPYNLPINLRTDLADFYIRDTVKRFGEVINRQKDIKNLQVIKTRVTDEALRKMKRLRNKFVEENPDVRRQITIKNSRQIDKSTIRVFFTAYDQNKNFEEKSFEMVADVNFYLNHEKAGTATVLYQERADRLLNPLGIQIYDYNILKGDFNE